MIRILLSGACGRMGRQMTALMDEKKLLIAAGVDARPEDGFPFPVYPAFSMATEPADVLVDFSRPEGLRPALAFAREKKLPVVLAATGYNAQDLQAIAEAAREIPIFRSANLSLGIYVLRELAGRAAALLEGFDIEIIERHHNQKLDAPSGTALMLYDAVKQPDSQPVYGRHTRTEKRQPTEIGLHAVRGGTLAGEHEVGFYGAGETVQLIHSAQDRSIFALGALRAARFIQGRAPGEYEMRDLARALTEKQE